jgi:hypothetical protein
MTVTPTTGLLLKGRTRVLARRMARRVTAGTFASTLVLMVGGATSLGCGGDCTDRGCTTKASVKVPALTGKLERTRSVRVCANGRCATEPPRRTLAIPVGGLDEGDRLAVRMTFRGDGRRLLRIRDEVVRTPYRPNGPGCEPVCLQALVRADLERRRLIPLDR